MRSIIYANTEDLKKLLYKWKNTNQPLSMKELEQAMYAVKRIVDEVNSSSWEHCNRLDVGWD